MADDTEDTGTVLENPSEDLEKRVDQYIRVRARIKEITEAFEEQKKPLTELQNLLTGVIMTALDASNAQSVKTKAGTCYTSTRYTASLADPEMFMEFVKDNDLFELIDRKANSTAVRDYVKEHSALPPGVNLSAIKTVGVRAPTKKH